MAIDDDDTLDGCYGRPLTDAEINADGDTTAIVLFADVDPADADAIAQRVAEYEAVFGNGA